MIKSNANIARQPSLERTWLDRFMDFLLGPNPHPVFMAGAGAGFSGTGKVDKPKPIATPQFMGNDAQSASVALASGGLGSYCVADPSQRGEYGSG